MKVYISILFLFLLFSCNSIKDTRINQAQSLAYDINCSIDDYSATYYRYPSNIDEFYNFILLNYDLDDRVVYKDKKKVVEYIRSQKKYIYIYSTDNFMLFYGKKYNIVIDRTLGLCDWLDVNYYRISTEINVSNFFDKNDNIIFKGNDEFENNLKLVRSKYKTPSFKIINGDSIVNRGIYQYDRKNGLVPLCELGNLSQCNLFLDDLESYLKEFISKRNDIDKILFYTIIMKDNIETVR